MILILFVLSKYACPKILGSKTCRDKKLHGMQDTFLNILTMELSKQSDQAMGSNISTASKQTMPFLKPHNRKNKTFQIPIPYEYARKRSNPLQDKLICKTVRRKKTGFNIAILPSL